MKVIKPMLLLLTGTMIALSLAACGDKNPFAPTVQDKKVVMTVANEDIQYQEYRYFYLNNKRDNFGVDAALTADQITELQKLTAENIKNRHTLHVMAEQYDAALTEDEKKSVETYVADYQASFEDDESYLAALKDQYITDDFFRELTGDSQLAYAVLEKMKETGTIETGDDAVAKALASDDIICIKEIYVNYPSDELRDYASGRINEAYAKLEAGESFEALMQEYSSYSDAELPYEHGYYTMQYDALDEVWAAAQTLAIGEYSEVVESQFGFHIVLLCEKDADYMENNKDAIFTNYTYSKFYEEFYQVYATLTPEFTDYGAKLDFATLN